MSTPPSGQFNYPTSYRIGVGRRSELPAACAQLGFSRPLVVSDPGLAKLSWFSAMLEDLRSASLDYGVFADVRANPTNDDVARGLAVYREGRRDGLVLVGGGSPMDVGKCIALLAGNTGSVFDYEDIGDNYKRANPDLIARSIAIPTTAGTGSEVGRASLIIDESDHGKKIIFHPKMQPALVLADPELTVGLPAFVTAATGMDALAHCFEAYCAPGYHPMADGIALEGMRLIQRWLPRAFSHGEDLVARTHMMMAASMGATAFQKGLGLVHAWSHPLGGAMGIHHGLANSVFLPYVMVYNRPVIEERMQHLARVLDLREKSFDAVLDWMLELRRGLGLPHTLEQCEGVRREMAFELVDGAARDPSMGGNPRPATREQLSQVFLAAYDGRLDPIP